MLRRVGESKSTLASTPWRRSRKELSISVADRLADAEILWLEERREGALLLVLAAVAATARRRYPKEMDGQAFDHFLTDASSIRISVEFRGALHSVEHILYKWLRCELVHEGDLPVDIAFVKEVAGGTRSVRAGGAPDFELHISHGWFPFLLSAVRSASESEC